MSVVDEEDKSFIKIIIGGIRRRRKPEPDFEHHFRLHLRGADDNDDVDGTDVDQVSTMINLFSLLLTLCSYLAGLYSLVPGF